MAGPDLRDGDEEDAGSGGACKKEREERPEVKFIFGLPQRKSIPNQVCLVPGSSHVYIWSLTFDFRIIFKVHGIPFKLSYATLEISASLRVSKGYSCDLLCCKMKYFLFLLDFHSAVNAYVSSSTRQRLFYFRLGYFI